jgi:hypothetical protein
MLAQRAPETQCDQCARLKMAQLYDLGTKPSSACGVEVCSAALEASMSDLPNEPSPATQPPPYPEISPAEAPEEAPETSPVPQEEETGRPHDVGFTGSGR